MTDKKELPKPYIHYTFIFLIIVSFILSITALIGSILQINKPFIGFRIEPTLTVSAVNEKYFAGIKAGLKEYDKIIRVNDKEVKTLQEFKEIVSQFKIGDKVKYTVSHKGDSITKTFDVVVPVENFELSYFLKSFLTLFIVGIAFLVVGTVAYLIKPTNKVIQAHLLLMISVGLTSTLANDFDSTALFPRVWILCVAFTGATSLHLGLIFPKEKNIVKKFPFIIYIPYIISLILATSWELVYKPHGVLSMGEEHFNLHFELYDLNLLWSILGGLGGMIALMIHSVFEIKEERLKQQLKIGLYGATIAFTPMIFLWLIPMLLEHPLDTTGTIATICWILFIVFPISISYAVIKHKLFDIDFIIKQSIVYSTLIVLLGGIYLVFTTLIQFSFIKILGKPSELTYLFLAILIALIFDPLRTYIKNFIDKKFFREKYNLKLALSEFVERVGATLDMDELFNGINSILDKYFHPKHISLFLKVPRKNKLILAYSNNFPVDKCSELSLDNPYVKSTFNLSNIIIDSKKGTAKFTGKLPDIQSFEELGIELSIPIVAKTKDVTAKFEIRNEIIGLLNLGAKLSELDYTKEEEELLSKLMQQVALTIHHSKLTEEVVEKERMKAEFEKARAIQLAMLPQKELEVPNFEITGYIQTADETGGDYYDWYKISDNNFVIALGDVTGHGIESALIVAMAKSCLYNQINIDYEVPPVLKALNSTIYAISHKQSGSMKKLMTFVYAVFDINKNTMRVSSAGHWYPYFYQKEMDKIDNLSYLKPSYPLGVRPSDKFKCQTGEIIINSGDILVFFTDGLHEAINSNNEEFGLERLENIIKNYSHLSAYELRDIIINQWKDFIGSQKLLDDISLIVVKRV